MCDRREDQCKQLAARRGGLGGGGQSPPLFTLPRATPFARSDKKFGEKGIVANCQPTILLIVREWYL